MRRFWPSCGRSESVGAARGQSCGGFEINGLAAGVKVSVTSCVRRPLHPDPLPRGERGRGWYGRFAAVPRQAYGTGVGTEGQWPNTPVACFIYARLDLPEPGPVGHLSPRPLAPTLSPHGRGDGTCAVGSRSSGLRQVAASTWSSVGARHSCPRFGLGPTGLGCPAVIASWQRRKGRVVRAAGRSGAARSRLRSAPVGASAASG